MKRTRYSEGQIIGILTEHAICAKCADLCREHGPSEGTFYAWKAKYGGMTVSDAKRLKSPEDENAKLTKLLAEQMLDSETFACHWSEDNGRAQRRNYSQKMAASAAKREAVAHLQAKLGLSEQRACRLVDVDRKMIRYQRSMAVRSLLAAIRSSKFRVSPHRPGSPGSSSIAAI